MCAFGTIADQHETPRHGLRHMGKILGKQLWVARRVDRLASHTGGTHRLRGGIRVILQGRKHRVIGQADFNIMCLCNARRNLAHMGFDGRVCVIAERPRIPFQNRVRGQYIAAAISDEFCDRHHTVARRIDLARDN